MDAAPDSELEAFIEKGRAQFALSPAGKWSWNCDGGTLIFYDMCLILRRNGTGEYEGYTKKRDGSGFDNYKGTFLWEVLGFFMIRVKPDHQTEWHTFKYDVSARRDAYKKMVWTIQWHPQSPKSDSGLEGFAEEFDRGWGDLKDDEY